MSTRTFFGTLGRASITKNPHPQQLTMWSKVVILCTSDHWPVKSAVLLVLSQGNGKREGKFPPLPRLWLLQNNLFWRFCPSAISAFWPVGPARNGRWINPWLKNRFLVMDEDKYSKLLLMEVSFPGSWEDLSTVHHYTRMVFPLLLPPSSAYQMLPCSKDLTNSLLKKHSRRVWKTEAGEKDDWFV